MRRGKRHTRYRAAPNTAGRCPRDDKVTFRSYEKAAGAAAQYESRAYWCPSAGGWHITAKSAGDYDRARQRAGT